MAARHSITNAAEVDNAYPKLSESSEWLTANPEMLSESTHALTNNMKALAARLDLYHQAIIKAYLQSRARLYHTDKHDADKHDARYDGQIVENINQLADLFMQHLDDGNSLGMEHSSAARDSGVVFFESLKKQLAQLEEPNHPLASVVDELVEDEEGQTAFFVKLCKIIKDQGIGPWAPAAPQEHETVVLSSEAG